MLELDNSSNSFMHGMQKFNYILIKNKVIVSHYVLIILKLFYI